MHILSGREQPQYARLIIAYLQPCRQTVPPSLYSDCVNHRIGTANPLPQWYVRGKRMALYPWRCALFIDENHRGKAYGRLLIEKVAEDARKLGFSHLYLCTEHPGYYEKYGFRYLGDGYHPWNKQSRIYETGL